MWNLSHFKTFYIEYLCRVTLLQLLMRYEIEIFHNTIYSLQFLFFIIRHSTQSQISIQFMYSALDLVLSKITVGTTYRLRINVFEIKILRIGKVKLIEVPFWPNLQPRAVLLKLFE